MKTRIIQEPTVHVEAGPMGGEVSSHPAFGQISASRVAGLANLYGSDFSHNHFIAVRISESTLKRSLSTDWYHPGREYIEVYMSEAQWATFVSSLNCGSGPCCTIQNLQGDMIPKLPAPKSRIEQFSGEVNERLERAVSSLKAAMGRVDTMGLSKVKTKELKDELHRALQNLTCNLSFVAECFDEHAEKTVEKAKAEVHGYMTGVLMRAGVQAIGSGQMPLAIAATPTEITAARDGGNHVD